MAEDKSVVGLKAQRLEDDVETIQYMNIASQQRVEIHARRRSPTTNFKDPASLFSGRALELAFACCSDLREVSGFRRWNVDADSQRSPLKH